MDVPTVSNLGIVSNHQPSHHQLSSHHHYGNNNNNNINSNNREEVGYQEGKNKNIRIAG